MSAQQFLILAGAHFLALLSPGPDFFLLLNHSLAHGARAGFRTAAGIACGNGVFILTAVLGLHWLAGQQGLLTLLHGGGCLYLAWLGWQFWRATPGRLTPSTAPTGASAPSCFLRGFASAILNPKNALFYLSLFAVLAGDSSLGARALAGAWMFGAVLAWDCLVSAAFARARVLRGFERCQHLLHRASACVLLALAGLMTRALLAGR